MEKATNLLMWAVFLDITITLIGIEFLGMEEANPLGLNMVILVSFLLIGFLFIFRDKKLNKFTTYLFYFLAVCRFGAVAWNLGLITWVLFS